MNTDVYGIISYVEQWLINPIIGFLMILASAFFIWGIIEFISSSSEEVRTRGKKHMIWGLVGLFIMLSVNFFKRIIEDFFSGL